MDGILILIAILIGYKLGSYSHKLSQPIKDKENKKEKKITQEEIDKKELEKQNKRIEIIETCLYNIDNYDGTGLGQKDIPYEDEEEDLWT